MIGISNHRWRTCVVPTSNDSNPNAPTLATRKGIQFLLNLLVSLPVVPTSSFPRVLRSPSTRLDPLDAIISLFLHPDRRIGSKSLFLSRRFPRLFDPNETDTSVFIPFRTDRTTCRSFLTPSIFETFQTRKEAGRWNLVRDRSVDKRDPSILERMVSLVFRSNAREKRFDANHTERNKKKMERSVDLNAHPPRRPPPPPPSTRPHLRFEEGNKERVLQRIYGSCACHGTRRQTRRSVFPRPSIEMDGCAEERVLDGGSCEVSIDRMRREQ